MKTRAEHMRWAKDRALEYVNSGDLNEALASMTSDLGKHPETQGHMAIGLGISMAASGHLSTASEMRKFIEGYA